MDTVFSIWLGHLVDDEVEGRLHKGEKRNLLHGKFGYNKGIKWRYNPTTKELFTWTPLSLKEKEILTNWLEAKGQEVERVINTHWAMTQAAVEKLARKKGSTDPYETWKDSKRRTHH
jgi:hypothetical protein